MKTVSTLDTAFCQQCERNLPINQFKISKYGQIYKVCNSCIKKKTDDTLKGKSRIRPGRGPSKYTHENKQLLTINKKRCNKCGKIKDFKDFSKHKGRLGGISAECKECANERGYNRYASKRFGSERMRSFKQHAYRLKVPFNLAENDLEQLWLKQEGLCYYSKIPMVFDIGCFNTVSVDRINSKKGYEIDNVVLCCYKVNIMKGDESYQNLLEMCKAIINNPLDVDVRSDLKEGKSFYGGGHRRKSIQKGERRGKTLNS